ncbi:MAG: right-handed parallel beta-helix repeat-containing protein [Polyangiaceae bacterium]|nr:right-handed parallel beta-helix repeat-containing protein [Polyangiaceae bacterium]
MQTIRRSSPAPLVFMLGSLAAACTSSAPNGSAANLGSVRPVEITTPPKGSFTASECVHKGPGTDYEVGPGKKYAAIGDVPMEQLKAGDTVRIHYRPEPYREKLMIGGVGKADAPIRVCGVRGPNGEMPVIDGENATTRKQLIFPYDGHQVRGLVMVGWKRSDPWQTGPEHIVIEGLELRHASPPYKFTDKSGAEAAYTQPAAGIFVQRGKFITIRGNVVHDNGNGLFVGTAGGEELTEDVLIEGNYIYNNGSSENYYHHNVYNEGNRITYQFNHFGPPKSSPQGILGANIKERSAGVVIRYNWIEDGAHLIDLVDSQEARQPNVTSPGFHESWVYGNVLVRGPTASGSMVHYGGDSGMLETYRKGTLHFFHNTVVIENSAYKEWEGSAIFELSTNDEALESRNNVYMSDTPYPNRPVMLLGKRDGVVSGVASFEGDWIREGIDTFATGKVKQVATANGVDGCTRGADPGFSSLEKRDFHLGEACPFVGKGAALTTPNDYGVRMQYVQHGKGEPRPAEASPTPGAFARK